MIVLKYVSCRIAFNGIKLNSGHLISDTQKMKKYK